MITLPSPSAGLVEAFSVSATCPADHCGFLEVFSRMGQELARAKTLRGTLVAITSFVDASTRGRAWALFLFGRSAPEMRWVAGGGGWLHLEGTEGGLSAGFDQTLRRVVEPTVVAPSEASYAGEFAERLGGELRSLALFPVRSDRASLGCLVVVNPDRLEGIPFQTLHSIAGLAALALERLTMEKQLRTLVYRDPLTGLANRRAFDFMLEKEIQRTRRTRSVFSLVLFDLDRFKAINDLHGHTVGDEILMAFARLIIQVSRKGDLAVRLGGDEFALLLPGASEEHAHYVTQRLYRLARQQPVPIHEDREPFEICFSAGIRSAGAEDPEAVFNEADRRLYASKRSRSEDPECDVLDQWNEETKESEDSL